MKLKEHNPKFFPWLTEKEKCPRCKVYMYEWEWHLGLNRLFKCPKCNTLWEEDKS